MRAADDDACKLLSKVEITKTTGMMVGDGMAKPPIPGILAQCIWDQSGTGASSQYRPGQVKVILADAQHMAITIRAMEKYGENVPGLGSKAISSKAPALGTGAAFTVAVMDAKGGFGVTAAGKEVTVDQVVALAKSVESRR